MYYGNSVYKNKNMTKQNTMGIVKKLISIPSWVDGNNNEQEIGNWIFEFLKKNSKLTITKQPIGNKRFNILAQYSKKIDVLVTGHIDTVQPNSGWTKDPFKPTIVGNKLFGLGSSDMKCGIATMLSLCTQSNLDKNIGFLFYCDEEYDFLGMKKFIEKYKTKIKPNLIISLDGENMQIGNSCRGLIELKIGVKGKAGHAANPKSGINAIIQSFQVINNLEKWLKSYKSNELGNSTLNIAYMNGGGGEGNIIAEKCEYIVEIRVANENLNAKTVKEFIIRESKKLGLKITKTNIRHDLGSWITPKEKLIKYANLLSNKKIKSAKESGYIDIQMLWKTFGQVPTFSLGAGKEGIAHKANEYVNISNVLKIQRIFEKILCQK